MPTINQLSTIGEVNSADTLPVFDESNGDARKMSVLQLQDYLEENLEFEFVQYSASAANGAVATTLGSVGPAGSTAGNPQGWVKVKISGVDRYIPFW